MVSEAEFDKNQQKFREAVNQAPAPVEQPQTQTSPEADIIQATRETFNAVSDFFGVSENQRTGDGLPDIPAILSGISSDEVAPQDRLLLGGGVANAPASSAVYRALISNGLSKRAAAQGAAQAAQMIKQGVSFEVAADKAAFWAALRNLPKDAAGKKLASKVGADALANLKSAATPSAAGVGKILQQITDFVKARPLEAVGGTFLIGSIARSFIGDYTKGLLGLDEAGARVAAEFYANGLITKEQLHAELDGRGYSDPIIAAYEATAEEMKTEVDFGVDQAQTLGIQQLPGESISDYSRRGITEFKKQQEAALAAQQPANAQGLTQAQIGQVNAEFQKGVVSGEVERQKQESLQKKPPTMEELQGVPTGQIAPSDLERIVKQKTPNAPLDVVGSAPTAGKTKAPTPEELAAKQSFLGGFTPICPPGTIWDPGLKRCVRDTGSSTGASRL